MEKGRGEGEAVWGWSNSENAKHCPPPLYSSSVWKFILQAEQRTFVWRTSPCSGLAQPRRPRGLKAAGFSGFSRKRSESESRHNIQLLFLHWGIFAGGPATGPFPVNSASQVPEEPGHRRPQEV